MASKHLLEHEQTQSSEKKESEYQERWSVPTIRPRGIGYSYIVRFMGFNRLHWVLLGFTEFYLVSMA